MKLTQKERAVLNFLSFAGNGTWVATLKQQFPGDGDTIQSLGDKGLINWDSVIVEMTDQGKKLVAKLAK